MSAAHRVVWFEIPVTDIHRAQRFYRDALQLESRIEACPSGMEGMEMAVFTHEDGAVSGALVKSQQQPSASGTVAYLNGGTDLQGALDRMPALGGEIIVGKTLISPEIGYFALFRDPEGNTVGLHSLQ